jgi:putative membrane protein
MPGRVWDPGLQSERTRLAWVRTAAALAMGGLGATMLALRNGLTGFAVAAFALATVCGGVLLVRTGVRFRNVQRALHEGRPLDDQTDAVVAWFGALAVAGGALAVIVHLA